MRALAVISETSRRDGEAGILHHGLHHKMFIGSQARTLPTYGQIENNEIGSFSANCIPAVDDRYHALGTAHLTPATAPYLVESLWPNLVNNELPHWDTLCEAFRCGRDREPGAASRHGAIVELFLKCREFPIPHDIQIVPWARGAELSNMLFPQTPTLPLQSSQRRKGRDRRLPPPSVTSFGGGPRHTQQVRTRMPAASNAVPRKPCARIALATLDRSRGGR